MIDSNKYITTLLFKTCNSPPPIIKVPILKPIIIHFSLTFHFIMIRLPMNILYNWKHFNINK